MDFMNAPVPPPYYGGGPQYQTPQANMMQQQVMMQQQMAQQPYYQQQQPMQQVQRPIDFSTPKIELSHGKGLRIHVVDDANPNKQYTLHESGSGVAATGETEQTSSKKKSSSRKKADKEEILPASSANAFANQPSESLQGTVENSPTAYTYAETTMMLRDTLAQIDSVNRELVQEFNTIKNNRTLKNKHSVMIGLSENIGSFIGNRISAIREINSSISKSNDLDYKKYKDIQAATSQMNDDKYIADMYKAFLSNPQMQPQGFEGAPPIDQAIVGSGIVRANVTENNFANGNFTDAGYLSYIANRSPEQNLMMYEGNPDVKQVVVYDASTGYKSFQMMNLKTGETIQNVPVYDQMFMEDTTLDLDQGIARNLNLNETFPLIVLNDNVTHNY